MPDRYPVGYRSWRPLTTGRSAMRGTILVVDDERKLLDVLRGYLEREGLQVLTASSGADALALVSAGHPDLMVLDLGLPDIPGEEVLREVRARADFPVLVLTARASEEDRIRGLELGADDYVTKPFSPRELVLRVAAILRRGPSEASGAVRSYGGGHLVIDEDRRAVTVGGVPAALTPTEWGLLLALSGTPGRVYSRLELLNRARGTTLEAYERTIDSHIKNLRRKVEADPHAPGIIGTVQGGGYRLELSRDD